jgi:hypothetical protein
MAASRLTRIVRGKEINFHWVIYVGILAFCALMGIFSFKAT